MMHYPELIRNVAIVGHLHHGKTLLMDLFVGDTHPGLIKYGGDLRYTDTRFDEQERQVSLKSRPMSLILQNSKEKSYLVNLFDTPGHLDFTDEMCAALRICDGAILVVDCIEGVMLQTEKAIKYLIS